VFFFNDIHVTYMYTQGNMNCNIANVILEPQKKTL